MAEDTGDPDSTAARWFEVSISWESAGRLRLVGRVLREFVTDRVTGGWTGGIPAKHRSEIAIRRRDNGHTVIMYDHDDEGEANRHFESVSQRLHAMRFWDFCREVGIPYAKAVEVRGGLPDSGTEETEQEPRPRHAR